MNNNEDRAVRKVVIDPGHGGTDAGATGNNLLEKDYNLLISKYKAPGSGSYIPPATNSGKPCGTKLCTAFNTPFTSYFATKPAARSATYASPFFIPSFSTAFPSVLPNSTTCNRNISRRISSYSLNSSSTS